MSDEAEIEMRADHVQARQDHANWLREIASWRVDHRKAQAVLARVSAEFFDLDAELEAHASAIRNHQFEMKVHERALDGETRADIAELYTRRHKELHAVHGSVDEHHASLRTRHNEMMNDLASLVEALSYEQLE